MAKESIYRKRECDLCGAYTFEKHLGTAQVLDGGFTRIEDWEESGFGSIVINFWSCKDINNNRVDLKLCPECARKLDNELSEIIRKARTVGAEEQKEGCK